MENNEKKLFKFINPCDNDEFSEMDGFDVNYLLELLKDYLIDFRRVLNLDDKLSFGFEFEFERAQIKAINEELSKKFDDSLWELGSDHTVYKGAEISTPILQDTYEDWKSIDLICKILKKYAKDGETCGGHIHIGSQALGRNPRYWLNFLKLWAAYERVLYRFSYGEHLTGRLLISEYATPIYKKTLDCYNSLKEDPKLTVRKILSYVTRDRYQAVNFRNVRVEGIGKLTDLNTIEFRCPNGTLNKTIWQNNLNTFYHLLCFASRDDFSDEFVTNKLYSIPEDSQDMWLYDNIYITDALELCDLIFSNNLDKVNFLKQYFKDMARYNGCSYNAAVRKLTKD